MSDFSPLELKIFFINVVGLADSTWNWSWLKWDRQLEQISNFSISQSNELEVADIDWLKSILSWVVVARFVIDRVSFLAYVANIYTILTRRRQNLLILWMVLSFLKDIILEVVVIVTTFLLWHKRSVSTWRLVEFVAEKTICLVISTCKWCTILKWYTQLQRVAEIRRFTIIARRSIASIADVPGRVGRSLDDECLGIAIIRRGKYASLLNLDRLSEKSASREISKSLTTLTTDDNHDANGANDCDSGVNDLSVAEKSMRMLNITAEDVMDARSRIQERSYWNEQDEIAKTPEAVEKVMAGLSLERDEEEIIDPSRNEETAKDDLKETVSRALRKEDVMRDSPMKKEGKKDERETVSVDGKEQILIGKQEDVLLVKSEDVTFDKVDNDHAKSMESRDIYATPTKRRKEGKEGVAEIVQYPSFQSARNMGAKPCASLVRKLEAKLHSIPVNRQEERIDRADRRRHPCSVNPQSAPTGSGAIKKERHKTSCACHRALRNTSKNGKHARSSDTNGKNVEYDVNGKEFRSLAPVVNAQRGKFEKSAFRYSETYRLKKQIREWEESRREQSVDWESKSLAETARPSGYAKNVIDAPGKLSDKKNIRTGTRDEPSDSFGARYKSRHEQARGRRPFDLRSVYNVGSFKERNYAECKAHETTEARALENYNNFTSSRRDGGGAKARKGSDLLPAKRKLSTEEREATELRALRAYNELTLSKDKRELEERREHDSSLNYGRLGKDPEVPGMKVSKTYNDLILPGDKKETERVRGQNSSPSPKRSIDERSVSRVRNGLARSEGKRELQARGERDSSRDETPSECGEDVETPTSTLNRLSVASYGGTAVRSSETPRNANSSFDLSDRRARQARGSLNLREITRNIEWTVHPRGIILTNKNLHGRFLEYGGFREAQECDIVDDNTASMLHSAFFFKPEIITRVFRRAQARIGESSPSFPTLRRGDLDAEFVCRTSNEMVVRDRNSADRSLERMMGSNPEDPIPSNADNSRGTRGERDRDLCIIFVDREQIPNVSDAAITGDSTTAGSQEAARSSIDGTRTTNILVLGEDRDRAGSAINDNPPVQLITGVLRNFGIELSTGNMRDVALPIEESGDVSNVHNNSQPQEFSGDDVNSIEESNNERDRISSRENVDVDDTIHEIKQTLNPNDNYPDNVNVTSYVSSLEKLNNTGDEKYLNATDIHSENEICENNLSTKSNDNNATSQLLDNNNNNNNNNKQLVNKIEKNMFNRTFKNSSRLFHDRAGPSSSIGSDNCHALRSSDEEFQKLTQLSDSEDTLRGQKKESVLNLKTMNYDTIPQFRNVETLKLETTVQDDAGSKKEDRDVCEEADEFFAEKIFKMHSAEDLKDDSFYFMYDRNDDSGTAVSLGNGSLMEEFLNDPVTPETSPNASARNYAYSQ